LAGRSGKRKSFTSSELLEMDSHPQSRPQVVAIIPARYHSNRFEGKPLALIAGRPMIRHVYERAAAVPLLARVAVATDDERIAECVRGFGGEVVMTSPEHASGTDRLAEAASLLGIPEQDVVVNIQGDQPLFPAEVVAQVATPLLDDPALPMATLIYKIIRPEEITDPNHVKTVFDRTGRALYFSRSPIPFQRDPEEPVAPTYYKHLGFYAYRKSFLLTFVGLPEGEWERFEKLEQLRALESGYTIKVVLTEHDSIEVDTPADLARVELEFRKR
jgi:3-deoxy-manno-octulosonate cytidylyltransferase (CMP-KDO synthetase)